MIGPLDPKVEDEADRRAEELWRAGRKSFVVNAGGGDGGGIDAVSGVHVGTGSSGSGGNSLVTGSADGERNAEEGSGKGRKREAEEVKVARYG